MQGCHLQLIDVTDDRSSRARPPKFILPSVPADAPRLRQVSCWPTSLEGLVSRSPAKRRPNRRLPARATRDHGAWPGLWVLTVK